MSSSMSACLPACLLWFAYKVGNLRDWEFLHRNVKLLLLLIILLLFLL